MLIKLTDTHYVDPRRISRVVLQEIPRFKEDAPIEHQLLAYIDGEGGFYVDEPLADFVERVNASIEDRVTSTNSGMTVGFSPPSF